MRWLPASVSVLLLTITRQAGITFSSQTRKRRGRATCLRSLCWLAWELVRAQGPMYSSPCCPFLCAAAAGSIYLAVHWLRNHTHRKWGVFTSLANFTPFPHAGLTSYLCIPSHASQSSFVLQICSKDKGAFHVIPSSQHSASV